MKIAIDGPSGSGKSSVAKELAKKLNFFHLNTGAMYRMLAYKLFKENKDVNQYEDVLENIDIEIRNGKYYLDEIDVSEKIKENNISLLASNVSKIKKVREYMVNLQRKISSNQNVILDGRDIGTVVFPDAEIKIYLTASANVRAKRRYLEDKTLTYEKILEDIEKRDYEDINRENSPLKMADDAILINSDELNFEEVVEKIIGIVKDYESKSRN